MELDKINRAYISSKTDFFKLINLDEIGGKCENFHFEHTQSVALCIDKRFTIHAMKHKKHLIMHVALDAVFNWMHNLQMVAHYRVVKYTFTSYTLFQSS